MSRSATQAVLLEPGPASDPIDEFGAESAQTRRPVLVSVPKSAPESEPSPNALAHGRWFVVVVVLGLLVIAQTPFVVLWALEFGKPMQIVVSSSDTVRDRVEMTSAPVTAPSNNVTVPIGPEPPRAKVVAPPPPGALSGWVVVDVPVSLRISENGEFLGTTEIDRLMLPVGEHVLEMSSDELRFHIQRTVTVTAGETTTLQFDLPRSSLSINARPWAEAWVDGERIGETPIGNLVRTIGRHEVVLRHPQLGERRETVLVTLNQPAHLSVDLRQNTAKP